jgi:hypothetical protein
MNGTTGGDSPSFKLIDQAGGEGTNRGQSENESCSIGSAMASVQEQEPPAS